MLHDDVNVLCSVHIKAKAHVVCVVYLAGRTV